jgi:hypothetical protein
MFLHHYSRFYIRTLHIHTRHVSSLSLFLSRKNHQTHSTWQSLRLRKPPTGLLILAPSLTRINTEDFILSIYNRLPHHLCPILYTHTTFILLSCSTPITSPALPFSPPLYTQCFNLFLSQHSPTCPLSLPFPSLLFCTAGTHTPPQHILCWDMYIHCIDNPHIFMPGESRTQARHSWRCPGRCGMWGAAEKGRWWRECSRCRVECGRWEMGLKGYSRNATYNRTMNEPDFHDPSNLPQESI